MLKRGKLLICLIIVVMIFGTLSIFAAAKEITIGYVPKAIVTPVWKTLKDTLESECKKLGWNIITSAPKDETDTAGQVAIIEDMLLKKVDFLIVGPTNEEAMNTVAKKCDEVGVPSMYIDTMGPYKGDYVLGYVDGDIEFSVSEMVKWATEETKAKKGIDRVKMGIIEGVIGCFANNDEMSGLHAYIDDKKDIEVVGDQSGNWMTDQGYRVAQDFLVSFPEIAYIYCANDLMAHGAMQAIKEAGKLGEVYVTGVNGNPDTYDSIYADEILASIDDDWVNQGKACIYLIATYLNAPEDAKPSHIQLKIPVLLVNKETIELTLKAFPGLSWDELRIKNLEVDLEPIIGKSFRVGGNEIGKKFYSQLVKGVDYLDMKF